MTIGVTTIDLKQQVRPFSGCSSSELAEFAQDALKRVSAIMAEDGTVPSRLKKAYAGAISDIKTVSIKPLVETAGAFRVDQNELIVSENHVVRIIDAVNVEMMRRYSMGEVIVSVEEIRSVYQQVFITFVMHELRHRTQGVEHLDEVSSLKRLATPSAMVRLDVNADADAATACAAIFGSYAQRREYLRAFQSAIALSLEYFFQAFPVSEAKHHKMERAAGIFIMAGRLALAELADHLSEDPSLPLDTPLWVSLSLDKFRLSLHRGDKYPDLIAVANDDQVPRLAKNIEAGDFEAALGDAIVLVKTMEI